MIAVKPITPTTQVLRIIRCFTVMTVRTGQRAILLILFGCSDDRVVSKVDYIEDRSPSIYTIESNRKFEDQLMLEDIQDFEDANRGLIARPPTIGPIGHDGKPLWDYSDDIFSDISAPTTVNPSLWRQSRLNAIRGLFEVYDGVYQLRGLDLANTTLIRSSAGWIVIDPMTTIESTKASINFAERHLGGINPTAIIITHSHVDHFGGVKAWLDHSIDDNLPIIAPEGFIEEATSENIIAGPAMARRSAYMFGLDLETAIDGHVDSGLGKRVVSGSTSIAEPNVIIDKPEVRLEIDGIDFTFFNMPNSEAPAELTFYLPKQKIFCGAELVSRTMHNVLTLRGAKVRDAYLWSEYIGKTIERLSDVEIMLNSHHWPTWGNDRIIRQLEEQQDLYRFMHDQTVRLANHGFTPREIAAELNLPENLAQNFHVRGYYGTLSHNVKAVYQHYFGWYDGNPAHLNDLPKTNTSKRYIELMGGVPLVLAAAERAASDGEYRWAVELLNHIMFSGQHNSFAKNLLAYNYMQMAYQAESGVWRDVYLSAAKELRHGNNYSRDDIRLARDFIERIPINDFLRSMAVSLNPIKSSRNNISINLYIIDKKLNFNLFVRNSVLYIKENKFDESADATIRITHSLLLDIFLGDLNIEDEILSDKWSWDGNLIGLLKFFGMFEKPDQNFNIVMP